MRGKKKFTYDIVKSYFEKCGCELLTDEYINSKQRLKYRCKCGNISHTTIKGKLNSGYCVQCKECGSKTAVETNKKNHGGKFYCDVEGRKTRWLEKFGVDNPLKSDKIKEKRKKTCLKRYGVEYAAQSDITKQHQKETFMKLYGVEYAHQLKSVREKFKKTLLKKYGVPNLAYLSNVCSKESQKLFWKIYDKLEINIQEKTYFGELNKEFNKKRKGLDEYYKYDFVNSKLKKCIEYNGSRFHPKENQNNNEIGWCLFHPNKTVKEAREYEKRKYDTIKEYGYDILIVWDYEIKKIGIDEMVNKCLNFLL